MAGYIGYRKVPTTDNGGGVWSLNDQARFRKDGIWPSYKEGRYWRLYITVSHHSDIVVLFGELELKSVSGGTDLTTGKTASASNEHTPAANGIDNNISTYWQAYSGGPVVLPAWYSVDLGSVFSVVEYTLSADTTYPTHAPKSWELQVSANGSQWITAHSVVNAPAWSSGESRTYNGF